MSNDYFVSGEWNVVCPQCGFHFKSGDLRKRWDDVRVCKQCWEPRHPLDLIKSPPPEKAIPWNTPNPEIVYIEVTYSTAVELSIPSGTFTQDNDP